MYEDFFGLKECPFNITPDPRFVYYSRHHQEALSTLIYGIESRRGFMQITGEVGAGKTTLCRTLLRKLEGRVHSSLVFNPKLSEFELIQAIVEDFGVEPKSKRKKGYLDALNAFLLEESEKGFNSIVILDEAHLLSPKSLENIRLLSNLETPTQKLLQIILVGQPELRGVLNKPNLVQLRQRITLRYHLPALELEEVGHYLAHRLSVAGADHSFFTEEAVEEVYKRSGGVPRLINVLADRAMIAGFTQNEKLIGPSMIEAAYADIEGVSVE